MILVAVLILVPAASLHVGGPGDAVPGIRAGSLAIGALIFRAGPAVSPDDLAGIGECDDEESDDEEGAGPPLDAAAVPPDVRPDDALARRCGSTTISPRSPRSPHLRC